MFVNRIKLRKQSLKSLFGYKIFQFNLTYYIKCIFVIRHPIMKSLCILLLVNCDAYSICICINLYVLYIKNEQRRLAEVFKLTFVRKRSIFKPIRHINNYFSNSSTMGGSVSGFIKFLKFYRLVGFWLNCT